MNRTELTVCELFAGVGGFHLGLRESGWKVVWANQWEPGKKQQHAFECYRKHFSTDTTCVNEDIGEIGTDKIPPVTLLVGGFPCQDYSVATTKAHGIIGKKGVLWWHIERILREKIKEGAPIPFVLLENVDRLVKSPAKQRGRDFGIILSCLNNLGYVVEWRVINAADYGYPQKRRRTFIFATLAQEMVDAQYSGSERNVVTKHGYFAKEFPVSVPSSVKGSRTLLWPDLERMTNEFSFQFQNAGLMKDGNIFTIKVEASYDGEKRTLGDILESNVASKFIIPEEWIGDEADRGTERFKRTWRYCKGAKNEARVHKNGHAYRYNEGGIPFPDKLNEPSRTMLTTEGNPRPNRICHIVPVGSEEGRYRILTPVEAERLNGFDDGWTEGMPDRWRYFCMGNALVVGLVEQMGRRLIDELESLDLLSGSDLNIRKERGKDSGPLDECFEAKAADKKGKKRKAQSKD